MKKQMSDRKRKGIVSFGKELKEELKKVSWTTKAELLSATKIVVISTFCFGMGVYLVDLTIRGGLESLKIAFWWMFG